MKTGTVHGEIKQDSDSGRIRGRTGIPTRHDSSRNGYSLSDEQ